MLETAYILRFFFFFFFFIYIYKYIKIVTTKHLLLWQTYFNIHVQLDSTLQKVIFFANSLEIIFLLLPTYFLDPRYTSFTYINLLFQTSA